MKNTLTSLAAAALVIAATSCADKTCTTADNTPSLIPAPKEISVKEGCFTLSRGTAIALDESDET